MLVARHGEEAGPEVRQVIESALAKLKDWLDERLKIQEDLLRNIGSTSEIQSNTGVPSRNVFAKEGHDPHVHMVDRMSRRTSTPISCRSRDQDTSCDTGNRGSAMSLLETNETLADHSLEDVLLPGATGIQPAMHVAHLAPPIRINSSDGDSTLFPSKRRAIHDKEPDRVATKQAKQEDSDPGTLASPVVSSFYEQDWQSKLMDVFDQLDLDRSGSIDHSEFAEAFEEVGMPDVRALGVFRAMDKSDNGLIDRIEWLHLIAEAEHGSDHEMSMLTEFLDRLAKRQIAKGCIYDTDRRRRPFLIIRHDGMRRMSWDLLMMILLFYVGLSVPFSLGFGQSAALDMIDRVSDMFFCTDVMLNFRTSFMDNEDTVIVDSKLIAMKYLKSWFLLDLISSIPFDLITAGLLPSLTPARLLKIGKVAKVLKLLRISRMLAVLQESEVMEKLDQQLTSRPHQTFVRIVKLVLMTFLVAHWLACFENAVDNSSLNYYFAKQLDSKEDPTPLQKYLAAIYWAMTTLSTVGYGDITPKSDQERAFAMFAMVIGGSLYGYVIGSVTSIVSDIDLNAHFYNERMEIFQSWLDRHDELPIVLRRRLRRYFKRSLAAKSAISDSMVIRELSPELRADTAFYLINEHVRHHPMFKNIPNSALAKLVEVLQTTHPNATEYVVNVGDPGIAMYILVSGAARYEIGLKWPPPNAAPGKRFQQVLEGDSFGEEIIFCWAETYSYTIVTITDCVFHLISEDGFQERYRHMPELRHQMCTAFLKSSGVGDDDIEATLESLDGKRRNEGGAAVWPLQDGTGSDDVQNARQRKKLSLHLPLAARQTNRRKQFNIHNDSGEAMQ